MRRIVVVFALLFFPFTETPAADGALAAQRAQFARLYARAQSGHWPAERDAAANLRAYALYPYLEAADLDYRLRRGAVNDTRLTALFRQHPDLGAATTLRHRWLKDLGRRGEWKKIVEFYQATEDAELRCLHAKAHIRSGSGNDMLGEALALWLHGHSRPPACDAVFDWVQARGLLSAAMVEARLHLAMQAGETALVQALARRASGSARRNAERWVAIHRKPFDTLEALIGNPEPGLDARVLALGLKHAARKDSARALRLYEPLARLYLKQPADRDQVLGHLGLELALDREPAALDWYSRLAQHPADLKAREWRLRTAIYHGAWARLRDWIEQLPAEEKHQQRWRYWRARAYDGLGGEGNLRQAQAQYAALALERGYYAYLAADRLQRPYVLKQDPVPADPALRNRLETQPAVLRTREFLAVGMEPQARQEWRLFTADQSMLELRQSALIASRWDWHPQAIMTLARSEYWDDLHLRYPLVYRESILAAARNASVDSAWVYAITRAESLFIPDARSHAKAIGLMQLLPTTGRSVARATGIAYAGERSLLDPWTNLRLGSHYLRQMRDRFGGNIAMATAAYNAGPGRVEHWLPRSRMPADVWVENIPFDETRTYVQRVMEHAVAFDWRLGHESTTLAKRMPPVPARQ